MKSVPPLDASADKPKPNIYAKATGAKAGKAQYISPEIDLRGLMTEEGCERAGKYLDDAYLAGLPQVTLIHGKGTGALRSAIHTQLKKHSYVKNFRVGTFGEGENGVTIVELK